MLKPMLVAVVNHGQWPKKNAAELRRKLKQFFEKNGAEIPASLRNEPETAPAQATYEDKDNEMLLRKATLNQAAKQHFGLFRDPFNDEIQSADDVYMTPDVRYVREAMFQTACHGGFVAVVGESGAGKSTLREDLQDRINREGRQIVLIEPYVLAMEDNDQNPPRLFRAAARSRTPRASEWRLSRTTFKPRRPLWRILPKTGKTNFRLADMVQERPSEK